MDENLKKHLEQYDEMDEKELRRKRLLHLIISYLNKDEKLRQQLKVYLK